MINVERRRIAKFNPDDYGDPDLVREAEDLGYEVVLTGFTPHQLLNKLLGKTHDGLPRQRGEGDFHIAR